MSKNELLIPDAITGVEVYADAEKPERHKELIDQVKKDAKALEADVSTPQGRDAIKSMAYKVSRSKTALDTLGKEYTEGVRKKIEAVNEKRALIRTELDALRDEVRAPLTKWETKEQERVNALQDRLQRMADYEKWQSSQLTQHQIDEKIQELNKLAQHDWQDQKENAQQQWNVSHVHLNEILEERRAQDKKNEELALLRKKEADDAAELARLKAENEKLKSQQAKAEEPQDEKVTFTQAPAADQPVNIGVDVAKPNADQTVITEVPSQKFYVGRKEEVMETTPLNEVRLIVAIARDTFQHYAQLHDKKDTPDGALKAQANREKAKLMIKALELLTDMEKTNAA